MDVSLSLICKIPFKFLKRAVPLDARAAIVTVIIVRLATEKKRSARICFGISFSLKKFETATSAWGRSLEFFSLVRQMRQ